MEWQQIGEIILGLITLVLGGGGASVHFKHKKHSKTLREEITDIDKRVVKLETSQKHQLEYFREIKKDIRYIRKKLEGGK